MEIALSDNGQQQLDQQTANQAVLQSIHHTHKALTEMKALLEAQVVELAVGGGPIDRIVEDWPIAGLKRQALSSRRGAGTDNFSATAAAALLLVEANLGRLGGTIVNSGSNSAIIYLADKERISGGVTAGIPALFLAAGGGSWDFRLGTALWCGPVSVISTNGTTFTIAQF